MGIINLKDFYSWYTHDEYLEVSDEIAAELVADKRYHKAHDRRMKRNKSYSFDLEGDMEKAALSCNSDNPEEIFAMMDKHCRLCQALNSLPEVQGRRIEAHYLLGKSQAEIAKDEGVTKGSVSISITRGLAAMKNFYVSFDFQSNFCSQSDLYI